MLLYWPALIIILKNLVTVRIGNVHKVAKYPAGVGCTWSLFTIPN